MTNSRIEVSRASRIKGALMGAFIGDALALGPHWYYDLAQLRREFGDWIDDYTAPRPGHYHAGLPAGASSQSGILLALTLRSLTECGHYDQADFCRRMDEFFIGLDGTAKAGPGGYTSQSIRDAWKNRQQGHPWGEVASDADNTDAVERVLAIAVRYASDPQKLALCVSDNVALTQNDPTVGAMTLAYAGALGLLIQGEPLNGRLSGRLATMARDGRFPFYQVQGGRFSSAEPLQMASIVAFAVQDHHLVTEPAWKIALTYGLPCAIYYVLPTVYHLAARFGADFESAVLHAVNGGGQNMARAMLTGALCGALGGFEAIPQRFVDGLQERDTYLALAEKLAAQA